MNTEQTEAARADFNNLWILKLRPRLISFGIPETEITSHMDVAWQAFRSALSK